MSLTYGMQRNRRAGDYLVRWTNNDGEQEALFVNIREAEYFSDNCSESAVFILKQNNLGMLYEEFVY